jgi:hypothetical protein
MFHKLIFSFFSQFPAKLHKPEGTKISDIEPGYYFDEKNNKTLRPVRVYKAIIASGMEPFNLYVDAAVQ